MLLSLVNVFATKIIGNGASGSSLVGEAWLPGNRVESSMAQIRNRGRSDRVQALAVVSNALTPQLASRVKTFISQS